jgi:peroxiredoxin
MANPLTGGFDAVVQIRVRQLNALLATLHQNGAASDAALKLLHSTSLRIGDPPPTSPDLAAFADWVLDVQVAGTGTGPGAGPAAGLAKSPAKLKAQLVSGSPPGVAARVLSSLAVFDASTLPELEIIPVKGRADVQISSVRLAVASGATSEITVLADVRARYRPDPGTTPLPEFIHGSVSAVFKVKKQIFLGRTRLLIQPSPDDQEIAFTAAAGSGLSAAQVASVGAQIRKALREGLLLLPVDLPTGFPFSEFKGLGSGDSAILALPLQLSDNAPPAGALAGVTQSVVQGHDFAFAVSKEHVLGMLDVEAIKAALEAQTFRLSIDLLLGSINANYHLRFSSGPTLTFAPGSITVSGRVEAETNRFGAPDGFVSFAQKLRLRLKTAKQEVSLVALGEPQVDKSFFIPRDLAVSTVKTSIAQAIEGNDPTVAQVFDDARTTLVSGLRNFDASSTATYSDIDMLAEGIVIQGELGTAPRAAPVAIVQDADDGAAFSAFASWIPGGHLARMRWSWVEYPAGAVTPWGGVAKSVTEEHRFILPKPDGITDVSSICLRVEGTRIRPDGGEESVAGGTLCLVPDSTLKLKLPPWWEPLAVPVWSGDVAADAVLADSITAHVSVQTEQSPDVPERAVVVYFPDWKSPAPLDLLHRALDGVRDTGHVPAAALVVVPQGALNVSRREFEARLDVNARGSRTARTLHVAEDAEGGWTRTFGATAKPALFVIDGRRECVWKAVGSVDPAAAAAAITARMLPTPGPRLRPLVGKIAIGQRAPDVRFRDDHGNDNALHRLRGRRVVFTFWQAWSAPSLAELRRLGQLQKQGSALGTLVAFHGGPPRKGFDDLRRQYGLSFSIVQDDEHRVARAFGVRCWPTTIEIDASGIIEGIQLGAGQHEPRGDAGQPYGDAGAAHCE